MTKALQIPDTHPTIKPVRAIVTTKWGNSGYRPLVIRSIEQYYVDSSLDNDADTWTLDIGDPRGEFLEMLKRNNEVRVQLFGAGKSSSTFLVTGMADEIQYSEQGIISLVGRDLSSLATDSTAPPNTYRHVRPWSVVEQQAKQIGFRQTNLAKAPMIRKLERTDGSESYWEFWYRLYRREQMWLWTEPTGVLRSDRLNYSQPTAYFFGTADRSDPTEIQRFYIPALSLSIRKTTQQRVGEVWVYWNKGDNGQRAISKDPTIADWVKKPLKILLDTSAHTGKAAQKLGWEEIFEGKVGSLEIRVTIPDPGYVVMQNRNARVRIPEIGFDGEFYIVGTRIQGGSDGLLQEIRMRERQYALTHRIPADPKIVTTEPPRSKQVQSDLGVAVGELAPSGMPEVWGNYFVRAANKWHGPWDYTLFLATLLGICDQETGFFNERENGGPGGDHVEWYPWAGRPITRPAPGGVGPPAPPPAIGPNPNFIDIHGRTREGWEEVFANEPGRYTGETTYGVGPMQLTSIGYKHWADDAMKPGFRDQLAGGRWSPEWNIWAGARALRDKLQSSVGDSGRDIDMWSGVSGYGPHDPDEPGVIPTHYALSVKNKVYNDPGYIGGVKTALQASRQAQEAAKGGMTDAPIISSVMDVQGLPTKNEILLFFLNPLRTILPNEARIRQGIINTAMWGYYNANQTHYVGTSTNPEHLGQRMQDFLPPPNIPEWMDCSSFATWCYKSGVAPDPNGNNYNGTGFTGTLWDNGTEISLSQLQPGDLVFYGSPQSTNSHVVVYVGQGKAVSDGSEQGPLLVPINYRASELAGFRTYPLAA
jgi:hypothetical protein